jgi:hypothetical protein
MAECSCFDALSVGVFCAYLTVIGFGLVVLFNGNLSAFILYITNYVLFKCAEKYNGYINLLLLYKNSFSEEFSNNIILVIVLDVVFNRGITSYCTLFGAIQYLRNKEEWIKVARTGRQFDIEQAV